MNTTRSHLRNYLPGLVRANVPGCSGHLSARIALICSTICRPDVVWACTRVTVSGELQCVAAYSLRSDLINDAVWNLIERRWCPIQARTTVSGIISAKVSLYMAFAPSRIACYKMYETNARCEESAGRVLSAQIAGYNRGCMWHGCANISDKRAKFHWNASPAVLLPPTWFNFRFWWLLWSRMLSINITKYCLKWGPSKIRKRLGLN